MLNTLSSVSVRESRIQYLCDPQWFRDTASSGPTTIAAPESQFRTCPTDHDSIGYPRMSASGESSTTMHRLLHASIRSTTIGKSRVARDPIAMHTSWRSNSDIAIVTSIGYPRMRASGESSTTKHRLLHPSGSHPIPPPNDPKCLNGTREQASNTVALDEKNRAKLVKDKPDRPKAGQLGEEKIGSGDLMKEDSYSGKSNQLGIKPAEKQTQSPEMPKCNEQASSEQNRDRLSTRTDDKSKLESAQEQLRTRAEQMKKKPALSKDQLSAPKRR
ncbi:hypothetical protein F511_21092 [Dorcoceras hygrometricum]|uniref:Uncharacterized protein n=1 Tax=Dorcoceras hygrometricum TaxID=472368 RepID=A0A2Z7A7U5_9LAMI|nr:hypothetical protein F511_21092 [Dorcoceras hygrometricum]